MARSGTPSFVRDPDQAAELAAILRDNADQLTEELAEDREQMSRAAVTRAEQVIGRYRRWAEELDPAEEKAEPLQIRPASWSGSDDRTATG